MDFSPWLKVKCVSKTRSVHKYFLFKNMIPMFWQNLVLPSQFARLGLFYYRIIVSSILGPLLYAPQLPDSPNLPTFIWSGINVGQLWVRDWESARSLHPLWVCWIHLTGDFVVANPHFPCTNNQSHCFVNDKKLTIHQNREPCLLSLWG